MGKKMKIELEELNKILIEEDFLLWRRKRSKDKGFSSFTDDYLKGYEDCRKSINDKIMKLGKEVENEQVDTIRSSNYQRERS